MEGAAHHATRFDAPCQDVNGILRGLQIVSAEAWATNFGVADIVRMKELYKRAPSVFRKATPPHWWAGRMLGGVVLASKRSP